MSRLNEYLERIYSEGSVLMKSKNPANTIRALELISDDLQDAIYKVFPDYETHVINLTRGSDSYDKETKVPFIEFEVGPLSDKSLTKKATIVIEKFKKDYPQVNFNIKRIDKDTFKVSMSYNK